MGKQPRKRPRHPRPRKGARRILRTIHAPIQAGFAPGSRRPASFWLNGELYVILHFLKEWEDEWHNRYYRVITDKGAFDIYRHRKVVSLADRKFEYCWWLEREIELYRLKTPKEKLKDPSAPWYWKYTAFPRRETKRAPSRPEGPSRG